MLCCAVLLVIYTDMGPMYEHVCKQFGWQRNADKAKAMKDKNTKELKELRAKIPEAKKNMGKTEVREAKLAVAQFLYSIGDKVCMYGWMMLCVCSCVYVHVCVCVCVRVCVCVCVCVCMFSV